MSRETTLAQHAPDLGVRRSSLEKTVLPVNLGALLDMAAIECGDQLLWNFFESGETHSYRRCAEESRALASSFARLGIVHGTHVGVMLPNITAFPLTWFALARLGAVMVPVNTRYRERELQYVLGNSDAQWLIADVSYRDMIDASLPGLGGCLSAERVIYYGADHDAIEGAGHGDTTLHWTNLLADGDPSYVPPREPAIDDLLNIQYTSGTTGFPKGCMLTQRYWLTSGLINAHRDGRRYRRVLASTPFYYMDPQWLLLMAIYQRGELYVAAKQSTSRFVSWLHAYDIEFCLFPYLLHKQPPSPLDRAHRVIRGNIYGAPKQLHAAIEERFDLIAREAFGMTEIGPALFMPIEATDMVGSASCGVPVPFRECKIVDEALRPVSQGTTGELCVRGPGIMLGYYGNPEATRAAFDGEWFRTGDLFRQDARGYYTIVGRSKDMIRRSAENVAAREVESVLNGIACVAESAAVPEPDELRGEEIKAFIVLNPAIERSDATLQQIIAACEAHLAAFKVPRYFVFRDELPKTPSLKIAKQTLRQPGCAPAGERIYDRVTGCWT